MNVQVRRGSRMAALSLIVIWLSACGQPSSNTALPEDTNPSSDSPQAVAPPADTAPPEDPRVRTEFALKQAAPGYSPGQTVTVTVTMDYSGAQPITALGIETEIPPGWQYAGMLSDLRPSVEPPAGMRKKLTFVWIKVPTFPATIEYQLDVPETTEGPCTIAAKALYRAKAGELHSPIDNLELNPASQ